MASIEMQDQEARDDEQYYDMLYNFAQVTIRANDMALDGHPVKQIAKKLQQSAEAFYLLCKTDEIVPVRANKVGRPKKAAGSARNADTAAKEKDCASHYIEKQSARAEWLGNMSDLRCKMYQGQPEYNHG